MNTGILKIEETGESLLFHYRAQIHRLGHGDVEHSITGDWTALGGVGERLKNQILNSDSSILLHVTIESPDGVEQVSGAFFLQAFSECREDSGEMTLSPTWNVVVDKSVIWSVVEECDRELIH
ncbi:hypothetical protein [Zhongshania sp.]|uniref:hypothetical protein n=1 Tax=Zhongshania sp. TaxID=1971902 RepID=UPI003568BF96